MSPAVTRTGPGATDWAALLPLLRELNDLKRIRSPELRPSVAAAWFVSSAFELFHEPAADVHERRRRVALDITARAIAATRLGAVSAADLRSGGMTRDGCEALFRRALHERREALDPALFEALSTALSGVSVEVRDLALDDPSAPGNWLARLLEQPRAGATAPGQPRLVLEPVESCAEHCLVTAVYAVLLAPYFEADVADAFAIGLAHHAHNARLPDAGFAGEALLGDELTDLVASLRDSVLSTLCSGAAKRLRVSLAEIDSVETPLARAFHTADTLDRVLQMEYFARCNRFTLDTALVDMELVHAGPVQAFQLEQLDAAGLTGAS